MLIMWAIAAAAVSIFLGYCTLWIASQSNTAQKVSQFGKILSIVLYVVAGLLVIGSLALNSYAAAGIMSILWAIAGAAGLVFLGYCALWNSQQSNTPKNLSQFAKVMSIILFVIAGLLLAVAIASNSIMGPGMMRRPAYGRYTPMMGQRAPMFGNMGNRAPGMMPVQPGQPVNPNVAPAQPGQPGAVTPAAPAAPVNPMPVRRVPLKRTIKR